MHLYRFSYPVTKRYPFKWFTPLVIILGLVLTVLFSFITYPANAYDMKIETTTDPGDFIKKNQKSSPFGWLYGDDLKPECEPYDLSVGSRFFTTNKGFLYTVDKVYRLNSKTDDTDNMDQSVPYLNNTLKDCHPTRIIIDLTKDDTAKPNTTWWISWIKNSYFEAAATCEFETGDDGRMKVDFSMKKSGVAKDEWDYILALDNASFWWGSQLLNTYWFSLMQVLSRKGYFEEEEKGFYNRGRFTFEFKPERNKTIHDVDFFDLEFHMISSSTAHNLDEKIWQGSKGRSLDDIYNNPEYDISSAITEGSYFAKVLHSFLVADLANPNIPNMLLNDTELRDFLSGKGNNINRQPTGVLGEDPGADSNFAFLYRLRPPPNSTSDGLVSLDQSWEAFNSDLTELRTPDATIYKKYACTGPKEKSLGMIVVLVLVADLVFLTTSWKLLNLLAGWLVEQQEPTTAMVCAGCLRGMETGRETPIEMQKLVPENEDRQQR